MAILISAQNLSKSFTVRPLFEKLSFVIESGERIGLIGPNGAGKSTLLKILAGRTSPDDGSLSTQRGLRVGYLEQSPELDPDSSIFDTVSGGADDPTSWEAMARVEEVLSKLSLSESAGTVSPSALVGSLSGGWKKRVALARELVREPDLLLLDEPTNHLDVESILWLEDLLARSDFATLTITHDRLFLQRVANRIIELDRRNPGGLLSVKGDYARYLEIKEENLALQERREVTLRNTLRRETEWLRRGAKARTTKQQARIQRAGELSEVVDELNYRNQTRTARLDFQSTDRKPNRLIEAVGISKTYNGRKIFKDVDLFIGPRSRIGLLGHNGCGKSTLLRCLLGEEEADSGKILRAEKLAYAYFEQHRDTLDQNLTVQKTLCPGGDHVNYRGKMIHVRGYLDRFMFSAEQAEILVSRLSGGEQARLRIAQLMLREANVLVLDEPTNDLDMATLDVLEDTLNDFDGAVLLVTHDRYFLDQVATQIVAFPTVADTSGSLTMFSGLSQWEDWIARGGKSEPPKYGSASRATPAPTPVPAPAPNTPVATPAAAGSKKRKMSYKEQRDWETIEARIAEAEKKLEGATAESTLPENASSSIKLTEIYKKIGEYQAEVDSLFARWAELEKLQAE